MRRSRRSRRSLGVVVLALVAWIAPLCGCGFALRTSQPMPFSSIAVTADHPSGVVTVLTRYLGEVVRPVAPGKDGVAPDVILDILQEARQKNAVSINTSGLVLEYELRLKVVFRVRTPDGHELVAPTPIDQMRSLSFNATDVLAKDAESELLFNDMQNDAVQQLVQRLARLKMPTRVVPVPAVAPAVAVPASAASVPAPAPGF